jgi:glutathione peroxidase
MLGFYSNDFGMQAGDPGACTNKYGITYQQFDIDHVKDTDGGGPLKPRPVFEWLLAQSNPGPAPKPEPNWNFNKYLVGRDGKLVKHWSDSVWPGDNPNNPSDSFDGSEIVVAIKAELAK